MTVRMNSLSSLSIHALSWPTPMSPPFFLSYFSSWKVAQNRMSGLFHHLNDVKWKGGGAQLQVFNCCWRLQTFTWSKLLISLARSSPSNLVHTYLNVPPSLSTSTSCPPWVSCYHVLRYSMMDLGLSRWLDERTASIRTEAWQLALFGHHFCKVQHIYLFIERLVYTSCGCVLLTVQV